MVDRRRAEWWCELGLRAWLVVFVMLVASRVFGTPWSVVFFPVWAPASVWAAWWSLAILRALLRRWLLG